jgi:Ca2+-binding EF-hand superfamily protein
LKLTIATDLYNLRYTFKNFDKKQKGYLTNQEFNELLRHFKLSDKLNSEDVYQIVAEFDPNIEGCFFYNKFVKKLIEKSY